MSNISWLTTSLNVEGTESRTGPIFGHTTTGDISVVRDPYRQMEVRIQSGQLKGYFATVIGSHRAADGSIRVDLQVSSQPAGYKVSLGIADVVGRL